ncbi:MAG TPA: hypothetical protein VLE53_08980 [Gemmatimonadaceae bacterium]|nr:hypothetical protein [Gemmatimonadaceae bacterium]
MDEGREFLRSQVNNAIMQHRALLENLQQHARQAEDRRFADLCQRHVPLMQQHQLTLEQYGESIGAEGEKGLKKALGAALGMARDAADAMRETDFLRLVGDVVMIRQAQDTFATFAAAGRQIGETRLAEIGQMGEREHDAMQREFNHLVQAMFVEHYHGAAVSAGGSHRGR